MSKISKPGKMRKISINVDGQKVRGTLFAPKSVTKKYPAVLFIHGWTSSENGYLPMAQKISRMGFIGMTISLRGHGRSDGKIEEFSRKDHLDDVMAAYDFLVTQKRVDPLWIIFFGSSLGGYLGLLLSLKRPLKAICLKTPALYCDGDFDIPISELIKHKPKAFSVNDQTPQNNKVIKAWNNYTGKTLLIEAEYDSEIMRQTYQNYRRFANPRADFTYEFFKGAQHFLKDPVMKRKFNCVFSQWLKKCKTNHN